MKTAIIFIVLCFAANSAFGQKSNDPAYKIRARRGGVSVTFQGKAHWLNVGAQIDAAKITETELLFAGQKNGFRYLVIDVSGQSKEKEDDRQCGAGVEANLLWIKLNSAWKISAVKSVRYESCWSSISLNDPFKITKKSLSFDFDNFRDDVNVKLTYKSDQPEKGFQIVETKLKEN
ncbi:MAG TPA: hypothetical protein VNB22_16390 [Pyrinomonadaceae bacterium]|jgi:hypothetical protein|nr:hypothetical protein [Pyrinomonadaceae bacterium]